MAMTTADLNARGATGDPWHALREELRDSVQAERTRRVQRRKSINAVRARAVRPYGAGRIYWFTLSAALFTLMVWH
jgi:hypothetical protein